MTCWLTYALADAADWLVYATALLGIPALDVELVKADPAAGCLGSGCCQRRACRDPWY
jgi:hypothetical protein